MFCSSIRAEDEVALVKNGDEENFIAAQFQKTLAELDEDSEGTCLCLMFSLILQLLYYSL